MPRDVEAEDEAKYSGEKKGMRAAIMRKAKKLMPKRKQREDPTAVSMIREREMDDMDSPDALLPMRENTPCAMDADMLEIRRGLEFELVARCDSSKIDTRNECWYMMDTQWLAEWTCFVEGKQEYLPPPISTWALLASRVPDKKSGKEVLREELEVKLDYRGVPPMVYFVLRELYGQDDSPMLCRFLLDIYAPAVPAVERMRIQEKPMKDARIMVNKCRGEWTKWDEAYEEEEEEPCCCGVRKEHIEAIIYWVVRCCSRGKAGRKGISYRKYKTVSTKGGEGDDEGKGLLRDDEEGSDQDDDDEADTDGGGLLDGIDASDAERNYGQKSGLYLRQWLGWG
jgi:hypothetical protein